MRIIYLFTNSAMIAQAVRNSHVACAGLVLYEHFLQLGDEVELFWKKQWSIGKVLFLMNRYFNLVVLIASAVVMTWPRPSAQLCDRYNLNWHNIAMALQVLLTHVILAHRLYAMYGNRRKILIFLGGVVFIEGLYILMVKFTAAFSLFGNTAVSTNELFPGYYFCAVHIYCHCLLAIYIAILVVETIFLSMALYKAWLHRPSQGGSRLMQELTRDSVFYFFMTFWVYLVNLVFWEVSQMPLNALAFPYSLAFSSIFVNRLLIAVRSAYYNPTPGLEC